MALGNKNSGSDSPLYKTHDAKFILKTSTHSEALSFLSTFTGQDAPLARKTGKNSEPILCGLYRLSYQTDTDIEHTWVAVFSSARILPYLKLDKLPLDILRLIFDLSGFVDLENLSLTTPNMHNIICNTNIVKRASITLDYGQNLGLLISTLNSLESASLELKSTETISQLPIWTMPHISIWQSAKAITSLVIKSPTLNFFFATPPTGSPPLMSEVFPSLKTLDIEASPSCHPRVLTSLPKSLTFLSVVELPRSTQFPDISYLENLESLCLSRVNGIGRLEIIDFSKFPLLRSLRVPSLQKKIIISSNSEITCLQIGEMNGFRFLENLQLETPSLFELRKLTTLQLTSIPNWDSIIRHLPKSLTSLTIGQVKNFQPTDENVLLALPPGMVIMSFPFQARHMSMEYHQKDILERLIALKAEKSKNGETFWFFSAKIFELVSTVQYSPAAIEWLEVLPPTLRTYNRFLSLTIKSNSGIEVLDFKKKLPFVSSLSLTSDIRYPDNLTEEFLKTPVSTRMCPTHSLYTCRRLTLPSLLKTLTIQIRKNRCSPSICEPSCSLSKISHEPILDSIGELLPETLTSLVLKDNMFPTRLKRLPRSLTHLELFFQTMEGKQATSHERGRATSWGRMSEEFEKGLLELPEALESLVLRSDRLIGNTRSFIAALPRNITRLLIPIVEKFENEDIALLPPRLAMLGVRHSENVTNEGFIKLPRTLKSLWFALNRKLTPKFFESIACFPHLHNIQLPRNINFPRALRHTIADTYRLYAGSCPPGTQITIVTKKLHCNFTVSPSLPDTLDLFS